jgi:hypothetical protein
MSKTYLFEVGQIGGEEQECSYAMVEFDDELLALLKEMRLKFLEMREWNISLLEIIFREYWACWYNPSTKAKRAIPLDAPDPVIVGIVEEALESGEGVVSLGYLSVDGCIDFSAWEICEGEEQDRTECDELVLSFDGISFRCIAKNTDTRCETQEIEWKVLFP